MLLKIWLSWWLVALALAPTWAWGQISSPIITGYRDAPCFAKGAQLVIEGQGFDAVPGARRVMLWSAGHTVETTLITWLDTQITVRLPDDPRLRAGEMWQIQLQTDRGQPQGNAGPMRPVCAAAPAEAPPAADNALIARRLADAALRAAGGEQWARVTRVRFTVSVAEQDQPPTVAKHDWDARGEWSEQAEWLLLPLRLGDAAAQLEYRGRHTVGRQTFEVLQVTLGPTRYVLYIEPATQLVRAWDRALPGQPRIHGAWDGYQKIGGLHLATERALGAQRIRFTEIEVLAD